MEVKHTVIGRFYVSLRFEKKGVIHGRGGEQIHGIIFRELKKISKEISTHYHDSEKPSAFAISYLLPDAPGQKPYLENGNLIINKGDTLRFIAGCVDEGLLSVLIKVFLEIIRDSRIVRIGNIPATIIQTNLTGKGKTEFTTYEEIIKKPARKTRILLRTITPVSFRHNGMQISFPQPFNVFYSLLKIWNNYSKIKFDESLLEDAQKIMVSKYNLRSEIINFDNYEIFGSRGFIVYDLSKLKGTESHRIFNILADFANYSGIGYKRSMGMGMVEIKFI